MVSSVLAGELADIFGDALALRLSLLQLCTLLLSQLQAYSHVRVVECARVLRGPWLAL